MKKTVSRVHKLFPGKAFYILLATVVALFLVSLFDLIGVAAILPIIQVATGADYTVGYLGTLYHLLGEPSRNGMVLWASAILVVAFILKGVFSLMIKWWSGGFLAKQQAASSVTLLDAYLHEGYLAHRKRSTAEILQTTGEANTQVYSAFMGGLLAVIGEGASIIMLVGMLLVIMPFQALIAFTYFGLAAFIMQAMLKKRNMNVGGIAWVKGFAASQATLQAVHGFRENLIHGVVDRRVYNYQEARLGSVEANRLRTFYLDLPKYVLEIIFIVGIALILGLMMSTGGLESASYLILFAGACVRILPSFTRLVGSLGTMRAGAPFLEKYERAIEEMQAKDVSFIEEEPELGAFAEVNPTIVPLNIAAQDLTFRYPDGQEDVLKNLNFKVPAGSSLALVGGSGSGKTTLIDIILGLLSPTSGAITVNGTSVEKDPAGWQQYIGYVPQDVYLSGRSVREEIAYGLKPEEIDDARVQKCLEIAELQDVIDSLDKGINTEIGENGSRLSGGQRQRLGIARAIYRNPSVLVLDEATSALDNETEHKITQTINRLAREITVIIVAHRLSTVRSVDQLLFMSGGSIVARGSFEEVRKANPEFARLVELGQLPD